MTVRKRRLSSLQLSSLHLRVCGLVLAAAGCIGSLIQSRILGVGRLPVAELYTLLSDLPNGMAYAALSLICQVLELCAIPIFAFLLIEGTAHTASFGKYFFRVLLLAFGSEIPYNLATAGRVISIGDLNPVFGAVMALAMLYFFRAYPDKKTAHRIVKALAVLGAFLWCNFIGVAFGASCILITAALWAARGKQNIQLLAGSAVSMACSVFTPLYLFTPISLLAIHLYSGERGRDNRFFQYLAYPVALIACYLLSRVVS